MQTTKFFLIILGGILIATCVKAQTGFIYVHQKNINEESSVDFSFSLKNSSGTTTNTWQLNDQATADNVALSGNNFYAYDAGVSHGRGGDGQLWVIAATSGIGVSNPGSVYTRSAATSTWTQVSSLSNVTAIDGAYANQFVYSISSSANVYFYYNGSITTLPSVGGTVTDVTANGGRIAAVVGGSIYLYSASYTSSAAPSSSGTWTALVNTGQSAVRIDMNLGATSIAYVYPGATDVYTTTFAGVTADVGTPDAGATGDDVTYDDNGSIYTVCNDNSNGNIQIVASYNGSSWTAELPSRYTRKVTGGAAHTVWGVQWNGGPWPQTIWYRATDNTGTAYWIDDERIKNSASLNGNGIIIPVSAGTYTIQETLPNSTWDLGRFNLYDPGNASTGNVANNSASVTVTAGEVVYVEFVNEKLSPKSIALSCTGQFLETFDATTSSPIYTYTYGSASVGTPVEGTAYHYDVTGGPADGYYSLVKAEHTGNGGYGLFINASYAKDEFYRQRVTGLITGLQYTISFYGRNVSPNAPIAPNVLFGLQDLSGNIINQATTGNFPLNSNWYLYSFTFTATTDTADLFLRNQNIGGNGNDLLIDDISLNPAVTPLGNNSISPTAAPNICIGTNYTFSNSTSGGTWSVSPSTVATINAKSGLLRTVNPGNAIITYTYTNQMGCASTATSPVTVSSPPAVSVSDQLGGTACLNQTDSLYTTVSGGVTPYTYAWSASPSSGSGLGSANIANTAATPTAANTYTFTQTVTDNGGCSASASVSVIVSSHPAPTVTASATGPYCSGTSFNLSSTQSGGSGSYTYTWSATPAGNGLGVTNTKNTTATPTATGTYSYSILVNDGFCKVTKSVSATINSSPAVSVTGPTGTQQLCAGGIFSISSIASGGSGTYSYAWTGSRVSGPDNPGSAGLQSPTNTQIVTAKPTLTSSTSTNPDVYKYAVVVTDGNGCTASGSTNVTAYINSAYNAPAVSVTSPSTATSFCLGGSVTLTATVTPVSNNLTGTVIGAASTDGYPLSNAFDGMPATFYDYGSANGGWVGLDLGAPRVITSLRYYPRTLLESRMVNGVFQGSNVADFSSGVTTFYTITSTPSDAYHTVSTGSTSSFRYVRYLGPNGSYGNIAELSFYGYSVSYLWSANPSANGGIATATALSTTATPTAAGSYIYNFAVTDNNGCTANAATAVVTVNSNPAVTASSYSAALCSNTVDSVYASAAGGKSPYTYGWAVTPTTSPMTIASPSAATSAVSGGTAGTTYTFTTRVSDANGCIATGTTTVESLTSTTGISLSNMPSAATECANSPITLSPTISNTVSATGTVIGAASTDGYPLSNAFDGNPTTFYDYGSADGGWVGLDLGMPTVIDAISYYPRATLESRMVGGEFQGSNTADFSSGVTTFYTIKTTPSDQYYTVPTNNATAFRYVRYLSPNNGWGDIAELIFYKDPGTNTYLWTATPTGNGLGSTNTLSTTATPSAAGSFTYTLKATDVNGCAASASTGVQTINPALIVAVTPGTTAFCGSTGSTALSATVSGGSGTYSSYVWGGSLVSGTGSTSVNPSSSTSSNTTTATTSGGTAGSSTFQYSATVTDSQGCTATGTSSTVSVVASPTLTTPTATMPSPCLGQTINLSSSFSGGTAPYSYTWTVPTNASIATTTGTASPIATTATVSATGQYLFALQLVDANNCVVSAATAVLTVNSNPVVSLSSNNYSVCANPATTINLTGNLTTTTTSPYTYAWSGSGVVNNTTSITTTAVPAASGVFGLTVTDANGCTAAATTANVAVDQASPNISITCGTNSSGVNYGHLNETNGVSWYWTTTSGGSFYPDNTLSANNNTPTSTLEAPYIDYNGTYTVAIADAAGCKGSGSTILSSTSCTVILATSNLNFEAEKQGGTALLTWSTASETNNNYFTVERSVDGTTWQAVGTVNGQGNSTVLTKYSFTDALPLAGTNYYRLKQVDVNGQYSYSPVRELVFTGQWLVKLYPNPVQNYLVLEFNNDKDEKANIMIQSVLGNTVFATEQQLAKGLNRIVLNQVQLLANGTYILVMGNTENTFRSKFVKGGN